MLKNLKVTTKLVAILVAPVLVVVVLAYVGVRQRLVAACAGGMVMGAGAVLARGCTSGQALTGGALLSVGSWIFVGGAFAAAYLIAPAMKWSWR